MNRANSKGLKRLVLCVGALMLVGLAAGCWADRHMHPNMGRAFKKVMRKQTRITKRDVQHIEMSGEDAEVAFENLHKSAKKSAHGSRASRFLVPLQR